MSEINPTPLVSCDCCGDRVQKERSGDKWKRPLKWSSLSVPPSYWDRYPNHITFQDVCPSCCVRLNKVVSAEIDAIHRERKAEEMEPEQ